MNGSDLVIVGVLVLVAAVVGLWAQARFDAARIKTLKANQRATFANALRLSGRISELETENADLRKQVARLERDVVASAEEKTALRTEQTALPGASTDEAWV